VTVPLQVFFVLQFLQFHDGSLAECNKLK
jgi:hypothetical protein